MKVPSFGAISPAVPDIALVVEQFVRSIHCFEVYEDFRVFKEHITVNVSII